MNQILSTNNNYKKKNTELIDMKKIIIVFSVLILLLAIVIISATAIGMIKQKNEDKQDPIANLNKPTVTIKKIENGCSIYAEYDEGLQKITYRWNDGDSMEKNMYGATKFERTIEIPEGDSNIFYFEAIGSDGSVNTVEKIFTNDGIEEYDSRPQLERNFDYTRGENGVFEIIAKSDAGMKSVTYQVNDGEMQTVNSTEDNQKEIKIEIEAKRGNNKIYMIATDINGKTTEKNETIIGVKKPEIDIKLELPRTLKININHDMGFKKVVIKINNKEIVYDENHPAYNPEFQTLNLEEELSVGRNNIEVKVYTLEYPEREYVEGGWTEISE